MSRPVEKRIEDFIDNPSFYKLYSRNSSLYSIEVFGFTSKQYLNKVYGLIWDELAVNTNEFDTVYALRDQSNEVFAKIRERINEVESIKDYYEDYALPDYKKFIDCTTLLDEKYSEKKEYDPQELEDDFAEFSSLYSKMIAQCYIIFISDKPLSDALYEALREYFKDANEEEISNYAQLVSVPLRKTAVVNERLDFLKLRILKDDNAEEFEEQLSKHWREYNWFPIYNPSDDVYTKEFYLEELNKMSVEEAKGELEATEKEQQEHEKQYMEFIEGIDDNYTLKVVKLANEFGHYREKRNDVRRKGLRDARNMFQAIADMLGTELLEVAYMNKAEIDSSIQKRELQVPRERLQSRIGSFMALFEEDSSVLDDPEKIDELKERIANKMEARSELKGVTGSKGYAKGKAFVIDNINKLSEMKEGNILVTSMTAPDYVPAMRLAAAIVTDEGGITCHAAIISRELKTPCVIGTGVATQILKDGMEVEVDADKGIVKIVS